jgi:phosphohistidine phosphatase SixA
MKNLFQWLLLGLALFHNGLGASELSEHVKAGEHVLLMRHAYAPGVGDPPGYSLERCETQRLLNDEGKSQSVRIGQWLRTQGIDRASVYTSAWCRCRQTAELLGFGLVTVEPSLDSFFDQTRQAPARNKSLQNFIAGALRAKTGQALILVTHHVNIREFMGKDIGSGDMVLARVDAQGRMVDYRLYPSP